LGQVTFEQEYSLEGYSLTGKEVIQNADGSFLILANAWTGGQSGSGCLLKTDSMGNVIWSKLYSEQNLDYIMFRSFEKTQNMDILISGIAGVGMEYHMLLLKLDSTGNIIWSNCYGLNSNNIGNDVKELSDGNYIICGTTNDFDSIGCLYFIKTDKFGNTIWSKTFGNSTYGEATSLEIAANGNFVVLGTLMGTILTEFDNNGNKIWSKLYTYENSDGSTQWAVRRCPDDGFAVVGVWDADTTGFWPYLLKTDSIGNVLWCKLYTTAASGIVGEFFDLRITADSGFILLWEPEYPCLYCRTGLIKTDSEGNVEWSKNYTLNKYTFPSSAIQTSDFGYAVIGEANVIDGTGIGFIKTDKYGITGCYDTAISVVTVNMPVTTTSCGNLGSGFNMIAFNPFISSVTLKDFQSCIPINISVSEIVKSTSELKIFPNPAHQTLTLEADFGNEKNAQIRITDFLGQIVFSKNENLSETGRVYTTIDLINIKPGIYFVTVSCGEYYLVKKLIID
jgi:hypothetical protein